MGVFIDSRRAVLRKARTVNQTGSFLTAINTTTEPTGSGSAATTASIIELAPRKNSVTTPGSVMIWPYGIGSDNNTMLMRVIAWYRCNEHVPATLIWRPVILAAYTCTLSTSVGIAGAIQLDTERDADTIAIIGTVGNANVSMEIISPANNTPGHVVVSIKGAHKLQINFDDNSSATSMNAWYALS